ncbi:MAG: hypothetical protein ACRCW9_03875 [Cetobacterium sp.]
MLVDFKESFYNLVKDHIEIYDQTPPENTQYPFGVIEVTILPIHHLGHTINQIRLILDIWDTNTNTRNIDVLTSNILLKTNRVSIDKFYGKIESVKMVATQEENLNRRQVVYDYKYIGGY